MHIIGVLPAAGLATRLHGIPKFMLPLAGDDRSILRYHVNLMHEWVDRVICATRPNWLELVEMLGADYPNFESEALETDSMSETIIRVAGKRDWDWLIIGMPDTVFSNDGNPYSGLSHTLQKWGLSPLSSREPSLLLSCFRTAESQAGSVGSVHINEDSLVTQHADKDASQNYGHHWGLMAINPPGLEMLDHRTPHSGYVIDEFLKNGYEIRAMVNQFEYFDCGTFQEYRRLISLAQQGDQSSI